MKTRKFLIILLATGGSFGFALGAASFLSGNTIPPVVHEESETFRLVAGDDREEKTAEFVDKTEAPEQAVFAEDGSGTEELAQEKLGPVYTMLVVAGHEYEAWVSEGTTALELMKFLQDSRGFSFKGKQFPGLGFFVEEINGLVQNPKERTYWIYYINGETASVGASQYIVQPNDIIEWRYEKAN